MTAHTISPEVSIIIPCYNQGYSILETLDSALTQTFENYEVIIVNDGSDDSDTVRVLDAIKDCRVKIITTENQGLAAARNNGISVARGKYILPLDADDKIMSTYLEKGVDVLNKNSEIGIVYCKAALFGEVEGEWLLPEYSLQGILLENMIFCSALFRKKDWEKVGGYDSGMKYGWEDYEFWIALIESGREVFRIDEILFYYRVSEDSMVRSKEKWQKTLMFKRIFERHKKLYESNIEVWIDALHQVREEYHVARLYVDTGNGLNEKESLVRKVNLSTSKLVFSLENFKNIQALHFSPLDSYVILTLKKITYEVKTKERQVLAIKELSSNAIRRDVKEEESCFYFHSNNPLISIDNVAKLRPEKITVELSYNAIKNQALLQIIDSSMEKFFTFKNCGIYNKFKSVIKRILWSV